MITHVKIVNFRSFVEAEVPLRPFSLVIGANGSGKSNFLKFFQVLSEPIRPHDIGADRESYMPEILFFDRNYEERAGYYLAKWKRHINLAENDVSFAIKHTNSEISIYKAPSGQWIKIADSYIQQPNEDKAWIKLFNSLILSPINSKPVPIFCLNANAIASMEEINPNPSVAFDGSGTAQVLHYFKNGDNDSVFSNIEKSFIKYIPEVSKLSLKTGVKGSVQIQVREKNLSQIVAAPDLSEGTRLILAIITILHQENPPKVILLEDIDRGLHPRLFKEIAPQIQSLAEKHDVNIIATTHNPYLVDYFKDDPEAVIIVEKKDGASTLSTLKSRLDGIDYDKIDVDVPMGSLWFSGFVGGVPALS